MPNNPTLPPSLGALFRDVDERLGVLERGDKSLTYRQMLTTNDASNARELHMQQQGTTWVPQEHEVYAAALVNPKYPVMVARYHVILFKGCTADVWMRSAMGSASRLTQRWQLSGGNGADGSSVFHTFEVAWLHGMPNNQWDDTTEQSLVKRGNVEIRVNVKTQSTYFVRSDDFSADAQSKGFTASQTQLMDFWFQKSSNRYAVFFREPEYAFLAPLSAFPAASPEGTLIPGSSVPGYPVVTTSSATQAARTAADAALSNPNGEPPLWPNKAGAWPVRR